jgi:hypothetical protein
MGEYHDILSRTCWQRNQSVNVFDVIGILNEWIMEVVFFGTTKNLLPAGIIFASIEPALVTFGFNDK